MNADVSNPGPYQELLKIFLLKKGDDHGNKVVTRLEIAMDLCFGYLQIPTTGGEFMKEVNLIDDNFSCTDHKAAEMGHEESQNKIQLELNDPLVDVNDAIEAEDNLTNSVIKDAGTENGGNDGPFNNALIAEMEVDMYGLQDLKLRIG
ncbi:hypothetical protein L1887_25031 [Cichorium endivia]|nr:hypothetical protein L1887_25031 [Cichorium endivia]